MLQIPNAIEFSHFWILINFVLHLDLENGMWVDCKGVPNNANIYGTTSLRM